MKKKLTLDLDTTFYKIKIGDNIPLRHPDDLYTVLKIEPSKNGRSKVTVEKI